MLPKKSQVLSISSPIAMVYVYCIISLVMVLSCIDFLFILFILLSSKYGCHLSPLHLGPLFERRRSFTLQTKLNEILKDMP